MDLNDRKHVMLVEMFGENLASEIISGAEEKSRELEGHVAFKESEEHTKLKASIEGMEDGELKSELITALDKHVPAQKDEEEVKPEANAEGTADKEAFKEAFGLMSKAIKILSESNETLTKVMGELVKRLDSVDEQLVELKKSDDEKIAAQFVARRGAAASQSEGNILTKEAIEKLAAAGEGEGEGAKGDEADKHARPYVDDLLTRGATALPQGGDGS